MPTLHDLRTDFSAGRTGYGLKTRPDTNAYKASVFDASNLMVLNDGRMWRRWGTFIAANFGADKPRLEHWEFGGDDLTRFLLVFTAGRLRVYDLDLTLRADLTSLPWTADSLRYMSVSRERNRIVISDTSFATKILTLDTVAGTFSIADFAFKLSDDGTRLYAPFYQFASPTLEMTLTIFTASGTSTGYAAHITNASGIAGTEFDLAAGTGKASTNEDFFVADHVGVRMRIDDGEFEILTVVDARNATIKVWRDVARKLDVNPFWLRQASKLVEVAAFDHGLNVGDAVFFAGLATNDEAKDILDKAVQFASDTSTATVKTAPAATYTVNRVIDKDHFEVVGTGTNPTSTALRGGSDVMMYTFGPQTGVKEPAFSAARGWPQASAFHQTRLWLGGTETLPDAIWASRPATIEDFDPNEGNPDDALVMYGIGEQSRVRHIVPAFDLQIFCDNGEFFVPGSVDNAITQEVVRAIPSTTYGASYTTPMFFDGGTFFVDGLGQNIREFNAEGQTTDYNAWPASVVVSDWIKQPDDVTLYRGAPEAKTPYIIWCNDLDGSLVVMHSNRADNAFGFMRWTLDQGTFISCAGVGSRLFCVGEKGGVYYLLEFDTQGDFETVDFGAKLTGTAQTAWVSADHAGLTVQVTSGGIVYDNATLDGSGNFTTIEPLDAVVIGDGMTWSGELHAAVSASGQGPKTGKMQRLVSAEVHWDETVTGQIHGQNILDPSDAPAFVAPSPVSEWRQYLIGDWGRDPRMSFGGNLPGRAGMRAAVLNVYF